MLPVTLSVPNGPADICPTLRVCDLGQEASSPSASVSSTVKEVKVLVVQSCLTLCDPVACSLPGSSVHGIPLEWVEYQCPEYWSGFPFPSSGGLPNLGIEPGSPAMQADSLLSGL